MSGKNNRSLLPLAASMVIFGTVGIVRRGLDISSAALAAVRGGIGAACILLYMLLSGKKPDLPAIRGKLPLLILSGLSLGVNWVLLFEAYKYTSVAVATLCYYMAPVFVIAATPFILKEKPKPLHFMCAAVSLTGMALITLDGSSAGGGKGILLGLGAAFFYACVILFNKKLSGISSLDRTAVQLACAAATVLPYALASKGPSAPADAGSLLLLLVLGVVHTGAAYVMYFSSVERLPAPTVAIFGYVDPAVAVMLSAAVLHEPLSFRQLIGMVLILGSAAAGELCG